MPEIVAAVALAALVFGAYRLIAGARERRAAAREKYLAAVAAAIRSGDYREIDAVLALYGDEMTGITQDFLRMIRSDLYLKVNP